MFSQVQLFLTPWAKVLQASLSMGFLRPEYWSGMLFCHPGNLPDPEIQLASLTSPALAGGFFTTRATREAQHINNYLILNTILSAVNIISNSLNSPL